MKYRHQFEVNGPGAFPLDMLRYDSCCPATTPDAAIIGESQRATILSGRRQVQLIQVNASKVPLITTARWRSFQWEVVPASIVTRKSPTN
jgi:hypothetical protein